MRAGRGRDDRSVTEASTGTFFSAEQRRELEEKGLIVTSSSHVDFPFTVKYVPVFERKIRVIKIESE